MRRFLLVGKSGVGRSSFVNATFGVSLAAWSQYEPCTQVVESYARGTAWGDVVLIDTPGFADQNSARDAMYLRMIRDKVRLADVYALLFFSRLDETRLRGDEKEAIQLAFEGLGSEAWTRAWLVFTFAAMVPTAECDARAEVRQRQLEDWLREISRRIGGRFERFQRTILVDNVVFNWHPEAREIPSVLSD